MRKHVLLLFCFLIGTLFMFSMVSTVRVVFAQTSFSAYSGAPILDGEIDGVIGNEWNDAGRYTNMIINPSGTTEAWIKHDETYLYMALRFMADSNNPWVALQFSGGNCMKEGVDGVLFGDDRFSADGYQDITFGGTPFIVRDTIQDGVGAIAVDSSNMVTVELKKPLDSNHTNERDIAWTMNNEYEIIIMWDSDEGGSSGGNTSHKTGTRTANILLINTEAISEFPTLPAIAALVTGLTLIIVFTAKHRHRISL